MNFGNTFSQNEKDGVSADSSILELRKEFLKKIEGTWMLKNRGSNWGNDDLAKLDSDEILIITESEIAFYLRKKSSETMNLIKKELIVPKDKVYGQNYINLIFADKSFWTTTLNTNDSLFFINTGGIAKDGSEWETVCGNETKTYERVK